MSLISVMTANTKEMKRLILIKVHILLQSWWSMEGRQKRGKKISNLWQFFIS
jgi:hypothetical protein